MTELGDEKVRSACVGHFFAPTEAHAARMALEQAGIDAWVSDEVVGTMYGVGVGTTLHVAEDREPEARAVLDALVPTSDSEAESEEVAEDTLGLNLVLGVVGVVAVVVATLSVLALGAILSRSMVAMAAVVLAMTGLWASKRRG